MDYQAFQSWLVAGRRRALVMGVLNVTPDSFSDGGEFADAESAVSRGAAMIDEGADLIDIGGESTRPGAQPVPEAEQIRRLLPVINGIVKNTPHRGIVISVDTTRAAVAAAALEGGAKLVNDTSAGRDDPEMFPLVAGQGCPIVLMHMLGTPRTMQQNPVYKDVVQEVREFLAERIRIAAEAGIAREKILIDPGIGFGKTMEHNLELLRRLGETDELKQPMVIGVSRKSFIGTITGEPIATNRVFGTAAAVGWAVANGAGVVRVHEVKAMKQVVRMVEAIKGI